MVQCKCTNNKIRDDKLKFQYNTAVKGETSSEQQKIKQNKSAICNNIKGK